MWHGTYGRAIGMHKEAIPGAAFLDIVKLVVFVKRACKGVGNYLNYHKSSIKIVFSDYCVIIVYIV